jgi:hypothetical protein
MSDGTALAEALLGPDFGGSIAKAQVDGGAPTKCFHYA